MLHIYSLNCKNKVIGRNKLRKRNLFQLVPLVKDLTLDLNEIKILVSRTTLGQVKDILERYRFKRSHIHRKLKDFI